MKRGFLLAAFALAASAASARVTEPVAVMSFKNLNNAADLQWLTDGIAETMISDLRKNGMRVVERDRIDEALAEMALAGQVTQASTAAKIGNLVGAKTVVVGSFQQAGKQIRITARFVTVESGIVRDTAKTTGRMTKIFDLQDQIVARLLGKKPKKRAPRRVASASAADKYTPGKTPDRGSQKPKPKKKVTDADRLEAYRVYSLSLQTSSKAQRLGFLRKAVEIDPDFVYALDDLDKLEVKLRRFSVEREKREDAKLAALIESVRTGDVPYPILRDTNANMAMSTLFSKYRCTDLFAVIEEFRQNAEWFEDQAQLLSMCDYWTFACLNMMNRKDEALQVGERILDRWPETHAASQAQWMLESIIERLRDIDEKRKAWPEELEKLKTREVYDKERAERFDKLREKWSETEAGHMLRRLQGLANHYLWAESNELAEAYLDKYRGPELAKQRHGVYRTMMWNHYWLSEFEAARAVIGRWEADGGDEKELKSARKTAESWPR